MSAAQVGRPVTALRGARAEWFRAGVAGSDPRAVADIRRFGARQDATGGLAFSTLS